MRLGKKIWQAGMDKRTSPRSELTKQKISESLEGRKIGSNDFKINPEDGAKLRKTVTEGDHFRYQLIVDWYRDLKGE